MRGIKVQVTLSEDMVQRVDDYAKSMGISRSALCATFIGQGIMSYDKSFDIISSAAVSGMNKIAEAELEKNDSEK